jgi:hypothetical protein
MSKVALSSGRQVGGWWLGAESGQFGVDFMKPSENWMRGKGQRAKSGLIWSWLGSARQWCKIPRP